MLTRLMLVILLGAAPWGGIWFPSTAGIALGLGLPAAVGLSTVGQFGGVLAILGTFSKVEQYPRVAQSFNRVRPDRVSRFLDRYGVFGVPIAVVVLGAYAATASLATLGMDRRRIAASVAASLLMLAVALYVIIALAPIG